MSRKRCRSAGNSPNASSTSAAISVSALSRESSFASGYPSRGSSEQLVEGGTWTTELETYLTEGVPESYDVLKLLAFAQAVDTSFLVFEGAPKGIEDAPLPQRGAQTVDVGADIERAGGGHLFGAGVAQRADELP